MAVVTDLRSQRIPNWLTVPAALLGLVLNTLLPALTHGWGVGLKLGLGSAVVGCLLLLLVFGFLGLINFVGGGDVKLMAAVGALLRWPTALWALAYVAIAGGVIAVVYALARGRLGAVLRNLLKVGHQAGRRLVKGESRGEKVQLHRIPYALAIFAGAVWAAGIKYFPVLAVP